jgi:RNA polymerase sigma-32 factor
MDRRLRGDVSLNAHVHDDRERGDRIDRMIDPSATSESKLAEDDELAHRRRSLKAALQSLNSRERHIFTARYLTEASPKLETLAAEYGISRERVRQIEKRSFQKVKSAMQEIECPTKTP